MRRLVRKLEREAPGAVRVFYEAWPCGYALQRQVTTSRVGCDVVAPALIPRKPGERVKTNRRDARKLVDYALGKGTNPENKRYTALGSILQVLLRDDVGFEDAAALAAIIVAYKLYRDEDLLNGLAMRFQIPQEIDPKTTPQDYGPDIRWLGPTDDRELQSFSAEPPDFLAP